MKTTDAAGYGAAWERLANAIGCLRGWPDEQVRDAVDTFDATEAALRAQIEALTSELAEARSLADGAGAACLAWEEKVRSGELVHRDDRDAWRSLAIARGRIIAAEEGGTDLQTRAALVGDALSALAKLHALGVKPGETC